METTREVSRSLPLIDMLLRPVVVMGVLLVGVRVWRLCGVSWFASTWGLVGRRAGVRSLSGRRRVCQGLIVKPFLRVDFWPW
jgi:hypothetical protein